MKLTKNLKSIGCRIEITDKRKLRYPVYFEAHIRHSTGDYRVSSRTGVISACHATNGAWYRGFDSYGQAMGFIENAINNKTKENKNDQIR